MRLFVRCPKCSQGFISAKFGFGLATAEQVHGHTNQSHGQACVLVSVCTGDRMAKGKTTAGRNAQAQSGCQGPVSAASQTGSRLSHATAARCGLNRPPPQPTRAAR